MSTKIFKAVSDHGFSWYFYSFVNLICPTLVSLQKKYFKDILKSLCFKMLMHFLLDRQTLIKCRLKLDLPGPNLT